MKPNDYTHFYLYAKGWYKRSENIVNDLKVIMEDFSVIDRKYVSESDIKIVLTEVVYPEINGVYQFRKFISDVERVGFYDACLSVLCLAKVENIGKPDFKLLPPHNDITNELVDKYKWAN